MILKIIQNLLILKDKMIDLFKISPVKITDNDLVRFMIARE